MSLWFGDEQTYTVIMAEPQRALIERALSLLTREAIQDLVAEHPDFDMVEEATSLKELFEKLPQNEKDHPEAYHSFVD